MRTHYAKWLAVPALVALLSACSGEPSEGDMRAALDKEVAEANKVTASLRADKKTTLHSFKKVGCKADGDKAFRCDVEMDLEAPLVGRKKVVAPLRFVKGSDGWVATK